LDVETLMTFYRFLSVVAPLLCGAIAVRIGFEL